MPAAPSVCRGWPRSLTHCPAIPRPSRGGLRQQGPRRPPAHPDLGARAHTPHLALDARQGVHGAFTRGRHGPLRTRTPRTPRTRRTRRIPHTPRTPRTGQSRGLMVMGGAPWARPLALLSLTTGPAGVVQGGGPRVGLWWWWEAGGAQWRGCAAAAGV